MGEQAEESRPRRAGRGEQQDLYTRRHSKKYWQESLCCCHGLGTWPPGVRAGSDPIGRVSSRGHLLSIHNEEVQQVLNERDAGRITVASQQYTPSEAFAHLARLH